MPHDCKNATLEKGDIVLIPCRVVQVHSGEDFCNTELETLLGRRPDGAKEKIYAINTGVIIRVDPGSESHNALVAAHVLTE